MLDNEIAAGAEGPQDVLSRPRFAGFKIDSGNLERVLSSRDGAFIVNRIRGALGFRPIQAFTSACAPRHLGLTLAKVSAYSQK